MTRFFFVRQILDLSVSYSLHESMTQLIFVYYLHQQCLLYLSCFYSRLMSVCQFHFRRRKKNLAFFFSYLYSFESIALGIFTSYSSLYSQSCYIWIFFHMSLCVCAFVYVNNLCVYVCNLTNNAKNILSINAIIIYSFSIFPVTKKPILIR
jgi:hypothetical protein